ncbi:GNAT family N-acetyltransferase [Brevibacillus fulvus]|uniref:GNAT superfamily N-acetyltransferase n=1 Tax=Brevibacillus fulvus TaxID=1125967 RepID=A0A938XVX2_9BACL|nr:GNAT family N-acetyltransferase [Brevibacillus fulvus]MBM7589074.1 GNAT superfamily N-acetyltransferase [Brevibacillus fulvus]
MAEIRPIRKEELERFARLFAQQEGNETGMLLAMGDMMEEGLPAYGYWDQGQLLGVIHFQKERSAHKQHRPYTLIGIVIVHPAYRGRGIGEQLVNFVKAASETDWVLTSPADTAADRFFAKCGFFPVDDSGEEQMMAYFKSGEF